MAAKTNAKPSSKPAPQGRAPREGMPLQPPLTVEEHVHRIETLGKRIDGYVQFMVKIASQAGISTEAKDRAVFAFYRQMVAAEKLLRDVHDELLLE